MARLRQQYPQNYQSSSYIHTEFENLIRYINSAERGDKTISELMAQLFDDNGDFRGPIEFRLDTDTGMQYRVGEYEGADDGWITIAQMSDIRGPAGQNLGTIEGPLFYNREDITISGTPSTVTYTLIDEDIESIVVYKNGLLMAEDEYSLNPSTGVVTFDSALSNGNIITIYSIREKTVGNYRRLDYEAVTTVSVVGFSHTPEEKLIVYRNGLLQRSGGSYDYTTDPNQDTVTFFTPLDSGDVVTIITAENSATTNVAGLMLEEQYTDENGKILYETLSIDDGDIPQAKVNGLVSALASKSKITVSNTTPSTPSSGNLWLDTSQTPNVLKFYDGTSWLLTSPSSSLPTFATGNANQYVRVNGTGTGLEYGNIDLTSVVPKTYMGAANGVASLDSSGKLPTTQLPDVYSVSQLPFYTQWQHSTTTTANGTYYVAYVFKSIVRIDGIALKLSAGTCDVRVSIDGTPVGSTYNVTTSLQSNTIGSPIQVDGTLTARRVEIAVTNQSSAGILEGCLSIATLSV